MGTIDNLDDLGDEQNEHPVKYRLRVLDYLPDQIGEIHIEYQDTGELFGYTSFTSNKTEGTISQRMDLPGNKRDEFSICLLTELYSKDPNQKFYNVSTTLKGSAKEMLNSRIQYLLIEESMDRLFLHIKFESGVSYFHQIECGEPSVSIRFTLPVQTTEDFEFIIDPLNLHIYKAMESGDFNVVEEFIKQYNLDENIISDLHVIRSLSSMIEITGKKTSFIIDNGNRGISIELNWKWLEDPELVISNAEFPRPIIGLVVSPFNV